MAQSYFFRHYQVENGLSNNTVYCTTQDKNGFLWFGTKDGLNRFDGYHFKIYKTTEGLHDFKPDLINCLKTDKKGVLWVGSTKGLFYFDNQKEQLVRLLDSGKFNEINRLEIDGKNQLWFIAQLTLCRYNFETKTTTVFPLSKFFPATSLAIDDDGEVWTSTDKGVIKKFNAKTGAFESYDVFKYSPKVSSHWIHKMYFVGKHTMYIGTASQGLKEFDIPTATYKDVLSINPDKTKVHVRDIQQYSAHELWIATESGIFILNTNSKQFTNLKKKFLDPFSLSDNAVYSLCKDKEGGVWVGTYFGGINYYAKEHSLFQKYFADNSKKSISGNAIREICEDRLGNIWIGTEDVGLSKLNPKTGDITQFMPTGENTSIAYSNIHGLLTAGNDVWIGTFEHGLDIMDIRTGKVRKHYDEGTGKNDLRSSFIVSFLQTKSGDIYVGNSNALLKYNPTIDGFEAVPEAPANIWVSSLIEDYNHTIWMGTHGGVFYFNPITKEKGSFKHDPHNKNSLTNNDINAIYEDSKHCIWFSTEGGGLCKLSKDRKTLMSTTTNDGFPSNFIYKALEDNNHKMWVTTSKGLVHLNPDNKEMVTYTKDNGLLSNQFNYNSGYKDAAGKMYFGSVKGMITFEPDKIVKTNSTAPIYITDFRVENKEQTIDGAHSFLKKSIIYTNEITLPYDKSSFNIDFAALSYVSPEMTEYSYFMQGLDKEWTAIKPNRKVYFTNLSPRKYTFHLKAFINGNWSKEEKILVINILPPWWATTWAYLLYAILGLSLIYYLLRSYLTIIEDKKAKEIYEAKIDFFTNLAHEIRTPLTLIKGPVENLLEQVDGIPDIKDDVMMMDRNTNRLIALVTQILDFRKVETNSFTVDFVRVNITEMLKDAYSNFALLTKKRKLDYTIAYPPNDIFVLVDEEALNKILSNLFSNAIKFAKKKVAIRLLPLAENPVYITIEFENDGLSIPFEMKEKIFEPFYRLKESKQEGTGIGLALARSLTELLHGDLFLKETIDGSIVFVLKLPVETNSTLRN
ncbi:MULTISPECIES: two-component regulator propeller domain-containing protein [unclassified Arcicella]|uniref:ligand-binding sensor domain-containing protein n=1 Tax=unclassified Arcicella TaxID=2644986 RepID=UPI00285ACBFB|nr:MULTISPECIES: two-component regulator propeller domain-containing protein [unclassified Arcicella]MDR6562342.1 ligand-binding sensor domain-containing protein/signal transduction histidine kinase [Arcicella sp. BE51]MDR6812236.1 ligand-binding sensor domain-containing protein/signal transduction histidine kinase [Arcicella sp. BE140]MDR6823567.1 ligand-binding sensor domain-containing protein/signal transduction histidine kinase [Arcicella sp. BE139]